MGICPRCGSWVDDGDVCRSCGGVRKVENTNNKPISREEYFIRIAIEASAEGNHLKAINLYEQLHPTCSTLMNIAREYELMGDYDNALKSWDKAYSSFPDSISVVLGKANLLRNLIKYREAVSLYKEAVSLYEEDIGLNNGLPFESGQINKLPDCSKINKIISDIYVILGNKSLAEKYKKDAENNIDVYVKENLNEGNKSFDEGNCNSAKLHYERALKYRDDTVAKYKLKECKRVLNLSYEEKKKYSEEKKKELQRREKERKRKEEKEKLEKQRKEFEELRKKCEAEERKRKEECRKNPECIKKEIKNQKKIFKHSPVIFRSKAFQKDSDNAFREILELEDLLKNFGIKEDLTKDDIELLKKENKHLKYCINHFKYEYRANALKLFVKNYKKLKNVCCENSLIKSIFNSDSKDFEAFDVEVDARNRLKFANIFFDKFKESHEVTNLQNAYDLVNDGIDEIFNYLSKNSGKYSGLNCLNKELKDLSEVIEKAIIHLIKSNTCLFLINMDERFFIEEGSDLKLIKEDIPIVYYENKPIATIYDSQASDFEKLFFSKDNLKKLPKQSNAKYFFRYEKFDIIKIDL